MSIESTIPVLKIFQFAMATVKVRPKLFGGSSAVIINRCCSQAQYFSEELEGGIMLEMVYIPGGTFMMGSPEGEGCQEEKPQHEVTVSSFFMGKYPVTQAQWRAIAKDASAASGAIVGVARDLDPEPSRFKGNDRRPVECVSWYDAVEFCQRLSTKTGRNYRLPSEAEWEYACRAGTTTPFHFGETITTNLANYDGNYTYGSGSKGKYRQKTTPVGQFSPNAFGLYDMHGNVFEWCADTWHDNYEGAPTDGSAWIAGGDRDRSPLRGGSWAAYPEVCRSAFHYDGIREHDVLSAIGFRVVCDDQ